MSISAFLQLSTLPLHFLHYHWPVEREAVRMLSMISKKKKHGNWQMLEARSDKQNQYYYHCLTYLLSVPNDSGVTKTENKIKQNKDGVEIHIDGYSVIMYKPVIVSYSTQ